MSKHAWWNWILLVALVAGSLSRVIPVRAGLEGRHQLCRQGGRGQDQE